MALKAGSTLNFTNSLAAAIEDAMQTEWQAIKDEPLPADVGEEDRRILFVAIARGVLGYLHDHRSDIETDRVTVTIGSDSDSHDHHLDFDVDDL